MIGLAINPFAPEPDCTVDDAFEWFNGLANAERGRLLADFFDEHRNRDAAATFYSQTLGAAFKEYALGMNDPA